MAALPDPLDHRNLDHPIEALLLKRWSPRAMSAQPVDRDAFHRLLEAARWARSTYNTQEWRFLYAFRDTRHWPRLSGLLVEAIQRWWAAAGALVLVASRSVFEPGGKDNPVHAFDAGLATQNLLLRGAAMDPVIHAMAGFHRDAARRALAHPDDVVPQAIIAIGHPSNPLDLPTERAEKDAAPSGRNPIARIACEGPYSL